MRLNVFKKKRTAVYQPVKGTVIPLNKVEDEVFSTGMMGPGFAVIPSEGKVYSPVKGKVSSIFPTKHVITFVSENNVNLLLHIGLDTVELNGEGFDLQIEEGQKLEANELVAMVDLDAIQNKGKATDIMVIFPESSPELTGTFDFSNTKRIIGEI